MINHLTAMGTQSDKLKADVKRGDIYYIKDKTVSCGSEQQAERPGIIVSNNKCNKHSSVVEVVYLTTAIKKHLPTHVNIRSSLRPSVALCEQVHSVAKVRLAERMGYLTRHEIEDINKALIISMDLINETEKESEDMNNLTVTGTQGFMDLEIPVVLGGFGEGKRCLSDKTIAELHNMNGFDVRRRLKDNIKRFVESIDFIDLKKRMHETQTLNLLESLGYAKQSITQAEHIYLLSERGYAKLIKIMDTDLAWEIHDKLIDEYFQLRENSTNAQGLSPLLQVLINMEIEQKKQAKTLEDMETKVDNIKDIVSLNPNDWRKETAGLINKIALHIGGYEHIKAIREESYKLLNERYSVSLETRLTNKRRRMAEEGVSKSKRDKLNNLDVIADDKKLIEGFVTIVKDMAIKYGLYESILV